MDRRDTRILELYAQNCRLPNTVVADALNVSKDTVAYRVENLEEDGMLDQYVLFVDARKLGYTRYHLLVRLRSDVKDKQTLFESVCEHPFVMWVNTYIGRYDIQIIVDARNASHLNRIRDELFALLNHAVQDYTLLTHTHDLEFTQLNPVLNLGTEYRKKNDSSFSAKLSPKRFPVGKEFSTYEPDALDVELLRHLADDPQASLTQLARYTGVQRQTVKSHIADLIDQGVILNFGGIPDLPALGFVTYYLLVRIEQDTPAEVLRKPFGKLRNIFYAGRMLGDYDLILYLNARNPDELYSSIEVFTDHLGKYLLHYDLLVQKELLFWRQFTEGLYRDLKKSVS